MITWSLTLTGNQVAVLKALTDREFGKPWERGLEISHWITGTRGLLKEGLIEQRITKKPGTEYIDSDRSGQFLTARGRFILQMIEEDVEKFLSPPKQRHKPQVRVKKAA